MSELQKVKFCENEKVINPKWSYFKVEILFFDELLSDAAINLNGVQTCFVIANF